ncbi:hypothetical protein [Simplicispira suum]|nr:hypothetical protein [Simplicispira suum]
MKLGAPVLRSTRRLHHVHEWICQRFTITLDTEKILRTDAIISPLALPL